MAHTEACCLSSTLGRWTTCWPTLHLQLPVHLLWDGVGMGLGFVNQGVPLSLVALLRSDWVWSAWRVTHWIYRLIPADEFCLTWHFWEIRSPHLTVKVFHITVHTLTHSWVRKMTLLAYVSLEKPLTGHLRAIDPCPPWYLTSPISDYPAGKKTQMEPRNWAWQVWYLFWLLKV